MQLTGFSRAGILALSALSMLFTTAAVAKDGRDFAGHYSLTDITVKGDQVELTLALQLYNYSGADLKQAVVAVHTPHAVPGVVASFAPIKLWRNEGDVIVSQQITIPLAEYQRWSTRVQPPVFIGYTDENGHSLERWAQLSRSPIIPEARPAE
jgi:hypothetical protein